MPTKHRVMTLRDDLIFFVYLYQRYLYPVDKKRVNEFGRAYEQEDGQSEGLCEVGIKIQCRRIPPAKHKAASRRTKTLSETDDDLPLVTAPMTTLLSTKTTRR